jgi:intracellular sulfur oxidation DsrE/DsrF family protein
MQLAGRRSNARPRIVSGKFFFRAGGRTMSRFRHIAKAAAAGAIVLVVATSSSLAQDAGRATTPVNRPAAAVKHPVAATRAAKAAAAERMRNQPAFARMAEPPAAKDNEHHLVLQVNTNDQAAMNLALNNAANVTQYYRELGEKVKIEVVTFGPGLHMLREDTSPVKARIETMALSMPEISFKACGNTRENMNKAESKDIPIIQQAQVVKSGVVHVMELEEQGWTYVKP